MPALAKSAPSGASDFDLISIDGYDLNAQPMKKEVEFTARSDTSASFQHYGSLQSVCGGDQARTVFADEFEEFLTFRLGEKYGEYG